MGGGKCTCECGVWDLERVNRLRAPHPPSATAPATTHVNTWQVLWRAEVDLPAGVEISYKYVVFQVRPFPRPDCSLQLTTPRILPRSQTSC